MATKTIGDFAVVLSLSGVQSALDLIVMFFYEQNITK
jgi:hypothetical protein